MHPLKSSSLWIYHFRLLLAILLIKKYDTAKFQWIDIVVQHTDATDVFFLKLWYYLFEKLHCTEFKAIDTSAKRQKNMYGHILPGVNEIVNLGNVHCCQDNFY